MVKIKYIKLSGVEYAEVAPSAKLLPPQRREKIKRLRFEKDKLLSLAAGLLIRSEIGNAPLRLNEHGKPYAVDSDKFFSVSHSGDIAAIAVDDSEIGMDVEKLPDKDYMKIAGRFYHPNELEYVQNAEDQPRAFARIWTRKEAYLKQLGVGIAADLRAFDTLSDKLSARIASFDIEGYALSVCAEKPIEDDINISLLELKKLLRRFDDKDV